MILLDAVFLTLEVTIINPFHSGYLQTSALADSEDPDEMPHNAEFQQGLHYLQR